MTAITLRATNFSKAQDLFYILCASLLLGLCSQISIPLWFTPVPLSIMPLPVLVMGVLMGKERATLAVLAFLAEGAMGMPVFAGGASGVATLLGPHGGYLMGFAAAAYVSGALTEIRYFSSFTRLMIALVAAEATLFMCGVSWLSLFVGVTNAVKFGFIPFIMGDVLKVLVAAKIVQTQR